MWMLWRRLEMPAMTHAKTPQKLMETPNPDSPSAHSSANKPPHTPRSWIKRVVCWLLLFLVAEFASIAAMLGNTLPSWISHYETSILCALIGGIGGVTYCLRGVYLNACVRNCWDTSWLPWYFIRPVVSLICGWVSYLFIKAGLLVLDSAPMPDGNHYGFFVLAFVAGLNVDKFITKIEEVAQTTWGIEKSRASGKDEKKS
jgi:hypothetical protein